MNFVRMIFGNENRLIQKKHSLPHIKDTSLATALCSSFFIFRNTHLNTHTHTPTDENKLFNFKKCIRYISDDIALL